MKDAMLAQSTVSLGGAPTLRPRDTADVAEAIADAATNGTALRIRAAGGWMDAGRPSVGTPTVLDIRSLQGVVEYNPGDLTLTAGAATTLAEIDEATRPHGQWLPLDPLGVATDTLGATLATASAGPLAASFSLPRDLALGVEFVDGRGIVVRGGGRVVKNVAGFDLVRLMIGAWGTLGVITEATVRLRARPELVCTLALCAPRDVNSLGTLLRQLREANITPMAIELVDAALARYIDAGSEDTLLVRLAGNAGSVSSQRIVVGSLAAARDVSESVWDRVRRSEPPGASTFRCSQRPSELATMWRSLDTLASTLLGSWRHASVERGIVRCIVPSESIMQLPKTLHTIGAGVRVIGERLPNAAWQEIPGASSDRLSAGVRAAFDPLQLLNAGVHPSIA